MAQELAYVLITPYTLNKSRTGGILARLISRTGLDLVGARMFAPSQELVTKYADLTVSANDPQDRRIQELIRDYILQNLSPDPKTGRRRRVMMLLFKGEDAVRKTRSVVGNISLERRGGEAYALRSHRHASAVQRSHGEQEACPFAPDAVSLRDPHVFEDHLTGG